jgi:RNA polymerase sigma-70 factor, ECF subfamily
MSRKLSSRICRMVCFSRPSFSLSIGFPTGMPSGGPGRLKAFARGPHGQSHSAVGKRDVIEDMQACVPALRRYASALLGDRHKADDLVHDCLVRALGRLRSRKKDGDIRPWMFAIMHELDVSRTGKVNLGTATQQRFAEDSGVSNDSVGCNDGASERDLTRVVEDLSEDQRRVLLLVAVEDLSYADTARVLRVPVETVMSQLFLAREKLRQSVSDVATPAFWRVK